MKVALIQLSDIHFSSNRDLICSRQEAFCRSCKYLINDCSKVIFVISGDIANHGTEEQYNIAYQWLKECENFWKKESYHLHSEGLLSSNVGLDSSLYSEGFLVGQYV